MHKAINVLGDIRAEKDRQMLELAFYETPDFKTLIQSTDRPIVVGRRGTGKSALSYQLQKFWSLGKNTIVNQIIPDEDQVIGIRPLLQLFGSKYNQIKAGARIAWKYALLIETVISLLEKQKVNPRDLSAPMAERVRAWRNSAPRITARFRSLLLTFEKLAPSAEQRIANLATFLSISEMQEEVSQILGRTRLSLVFLIDQLDEGFEPDELGSGLVGGFVHAAVDINSQVPSVQANIFLRDNIFKTIAQLDPDYSKNIEGRFLRLHWDEHQLFDLICARLKVVFQSPLESNRKLWNRCVADELQGMEGFAKCLRLTLYRPRDLVSLLNEALYAARKQDRETIIFKDVESTAREISNTRFDDLLKEYSVIIPSLKPLTAIFRAQSPEWAYKDLITRIETLFLRQDIDGEYQREFAIMESAQEGIRTLYSVGFLGIKDSASSAFVFCHDGRSPNKEFASNDRLLVHPCYWMALDITKDSLSAEDAAEIHDEYEVEVYSEAPEIRCHRIGQLHAKLDKIPVGKEGAPEFEEWCRRVVRICFSGPLRNIELHPNKDATQRRDVVASNQSEHGVWRRILDDYKSRQVIFEVKNKLGIDPDDYRQMLSYLHDDYGRLGFIITRDDKAELYSGPELEWTREMFNKHKVIIIKLTGRLLSSLLSKLRGHNKVDPCEHGMNKILDTYTRLYLSNSKSTAFRGPISLRPS